MKILYTECGLGNQMFQYAYVRFLEQNGHDQIWIDSSAPSMHKHNGFELRRLFPAIDKRGKFVYRPIGWIMHIVSDIFKKGFGFSLETEGEGPTHTQFPKRAFWLRGYWQTAYFAEQVRPLLMKEFTFIPFTDKTNQALAAEMQACQSVAIHIRGGDYLWKKHENSFGGIATTYYYKQAFEYLCTKIENPSFYIFTNDREWAEKVIPSDIKNITFVENNRGAESFRDMQLMSVCRHNIIANSSFSWWGAWLNSNPDKIVIAPNKWFHNETDAFNREMIPNGWITMAIKQPE
ncbi:alpha-1,2-fucosyltransferase [Porphyromonadaceae bacterium]